MTKQDELVKKLEQLSEQEDALKALLENLREKQNQVLTEEQHQTIADLDEEAAPKIDAAEEKIKTTRAEITTLALKVAETTRGGHKMVVYVPPKDKWDGAKLEGYAIVHEDVLKCKTTGKPSVQIRDSQ